MSEQSSVDDEISLFVTDEELIVIEPVKQTRRKKAAAINENQLSLFDMFDFLNASA
jgi:tRNA nucleotidyltransferase (CCA-adding enzyme)